MLYISFTKDEVEDKKNTHLPAKRHSQKIENFQSTPREARQKKKSQIRKTKEKNSSFSTKRQINSNSPPAKVLKVRKIVFGTFKAKKGLLGRTNNQ